MNISLTPELDTFVENKVKSGFYHSASEGDSRRVEAS
jgi:putative addiction module CopG family antidote